jgi:hypothetical protein
METALMQALADGGQASFSDVVRAVGGEGAAAVACNNLWEMGLVEKDRSLASEITLSADGRAVAEDIARSRVRGADRRAAVQKAILRWLSDGAQPGEVAAFVGHPTATSFQIPFSEEEVTEAGAALDEWGLIKTYKAMGPRYLKPRITHEGREAADDARTPYEFVRQGGSITYNNTSTTNIGDGNTIGGVQTGGQGNTQSVRQSLTTDSRIQILAKVSEVLSALPEDADPAVRTAVEAVRDEAADEKSTVQSMKEKALTAMTTAVMSGIGHEVVEQLARLAQAIA